MTRSEFMRQLQEALLPLSAAERQEVLADFAEHFDAAAADGKTEDQICGELGSPYACAAPYLQNARCVLPNPAPPVSPVPPTPPVSRQNGVHAAWAVVFACAALLAVGVYPTCVVLLASPLLILIAAVFFVTLVPTPTMVGFLISAAVFLFSLGLFGILLTTYVLKQSYRRANL